jgi:hypothetical protein
MAVLGRTVARPGGPAERYSWTGEFMSLGLPCDGVLVEASPPHEAMATAHGVRDFVVLLKLRRRELSIECAVERRWTSVRHHA